MADAGRVSHVFSIPFGASFLDVAARALIEGTLAPSLKARLDARDPLALAEITVYVPTRRSARALAEAISRAWGRDTIILPRIAPLGALDSGDAAWPIDAEAPRASLAAIPRAFSDIERRLLLAPLILKFGESLVVTQDDGGPNLRLAAATPADAWSLAGDLGGIIDEMIVEGVAWTALDGLVDESLDEYWKQTRNFLDIAKSAWPTLLAAHDCVDAAQRRALLIEAEATRLQSPKGGPVIAIGSTGTNASTAALLKAIATSPRGAVVLPGLDMGLDEAAWTAVGTLNGHADSQSAVHPQAALQRLLGVLELKRDDVAQIGAPAPSLSLRGRFLSEAMRPATTTQAWRDAAMNADDLRAGLAGVTLVEAADEREEALAIAIALRETLEIPGRRAALITPDRALARRVRAELARWSIQVADSAGEALGESAAGRFARLTLDVALERHDAPSLVALLAHPDLAAGFEASVIEDLRGKVEIAVLRGVTPADCLADVDALIEDARDRAEASHAHRALRVLSDDDWTAIRALLERLATAFACFARPKPVDGLSEWIKAHREAIGALATARDEGDDVAALDALFDELAAADRGRFPMSLADYAAFFHRVAGERVLRAREDEHPRLAILGLLEARLLSTDLVILGGLDETVWPPQVTTDAFLNRTMRHQIGLSAPERRIGQTAHDFVMALGASEALLTRAARRGGSPMVASRFLQRMQALAGDEWNAVTGRGARLFDLARRLDAAGKAQPVSQPRPTPPVALRPTKLSVTRIETLRRDPYAIYAAKILDLAPLDKAGMEEGGRETGDALHQVIAEFLGDRRSGALEPDSLQALLTIARERFAHRFADPHFVTLAWPRLERDLRLYHAWEEKRRSADVRVAPETFGKLPIPLADGSSFLLTAEADRISQDGDGAVYLVDFKTGAPPKPKDVKPGFAPQLTLEGAMATRGSFADFGVTAAVGAVYVKLGGAEGLEESQPFEKQFESLSEAHYEGLVRLLNAYRDEATAYANLPWPGHAPRYNDYAHLARVKEWSMTGETEGEGGGE